MGDLELFAALRAVVLATERERLRMGREVLRTSPNETQACGILAAEGPQTPTTIAARLQITTASVTELVDRLEMAGVVERTPHPTDRRKLLVRLTDVGLGKATVMGRQFGLLMERSAAGFSAAERDVVLRFLRTAASTITSVSAGGELL